MTTPPIAARHVPSWDTLLPKRPTLADAATWGGAITIALGTIVLLGWALDADLLKSTFLGQVTMKANTAVCFVMMGAGVIVLSRSAAGSGGRTVGLILVGAAAAIAALSGAQYIAHIDLGIDQLLFRERPGAIATVVPGRMSILAATCFAFLGLAAMMAQRARRFVVAVCGVVFIFCILNLLDYVFNAAVPSFLSNFTLMATNTAVAMGVLAAATLALLGGANPFAIVGGRSPTAAMWRRLILITSAIPFVAAWFRLEGQRLGLYDTSYGTSLFLTVIMTLGVVTIIRSARMANDLEVDRKALEIERDRFFDLSLDMLSVVGADGRFQRVNGAWETTLGYRADELVGHSGFELIHPDDLERATEESQRSHDVGDRVEAFESRLRHRDGSYRWFEWVSRTAPDGSVAFAVARDVTDRKRRDDRRAKQQKVLETRNEALSERAVRDPLTGLHNRRYFDTAVARLERRWRRQALETRAPISVVIFDLDHFGQVNKQHGHQAGDAVLRVFAGLLKKRFRETDLVARYGGEEFVAVLQGVTSAEAIQIAEDVRVAFERTSIDIGSGAPLRVTVSAGCAQLGDDVSASAGISLADVWLSQAKRAGRNQVVGL
jgi:diguanylate cyclase (GGDEF)-like protein/PAS domain S-box-containing protein